MMPHDYKAPRRSNDNPIARARLAKGITQSQLAQAVGADQRQVSDWEVGRFNIPIPMMKKIAAVLDLDWTELADHQPEKKKHSPIVNARRAKGWTQQQFSKAISVSQSIISKYETGAYPIPEETLRRIAEALEVPIDSLRTSEPSPDGENGPK